jgi:hypothetical protein
MAVCLPRSVVSRRILFARAQRRGVSLAVGGTRALSASAPWRGRGGGGASGGGEGTSHANAANTANTSTESDYVVVGAGSAGCVMAARLSEDAGTSVTVLEAGMPDRWKASLHPSTPHHTAPNASQVAVPCKVQRQKEVHTLPHCCLLLFLLTRPQADARRRHIWMRRCCCCAPSTL